MNQSSQWPLEFINLETYPMLTLGSAQTQSVISQAQQQLKRSGAAEMPLFLKARKNLSLIYKVKLKI